MIHLIDASEGSFCAGRFAEAQSLCIQPSVAHATVVALGPAQDHCQTVMTPPRLVMPRTVRHGLAALKLQGHETLTAWGRRPAEWALRLPPNIGLSLVLLEGLSPANAHQTRWAQRLARFRHISFINQDDADSWIRAGLPAARVRVALSPTFGCSPTSCKRDFLRTQLDVDEEEFVIFPVAAPWSSLDCQRLAFLLGMLRVNGKRVTALVPANAWRLEGGRTFCKRAGVGARFIVIDGPMTPWLPACDAAFLDAAHPRDHLSPFIPRGATQVLLACAERVGVPVAIAPGSLLEARPTPSASVVDELKPLLEIIEGTHASSQPVSPASTR